MTPPQGTITCVDLSTRRKVNVTANKKSRHYREITNGKCGCRLEPTKKDDEDFLASLGIFDYTLDDITELLKFSGC